MSPIAPVNSSALDAIVVFDGVEKTYDGVNIVVERLDLEIQRGEFLTMLGPSGSGKTTSLMMLAGFEMPTAGRIILDGKPIERLPPHLRNIGVVFQNYALFPHMTVAENVAFPLQMRGIGKAEQRSRVEKALDMVQMNQFAGRRPAQLSGGQQQRIALARALVFEPSLVLMDEPLGALDKRLRDQLQEEISRLHRKLGITVIYVTHDQQEAMSMSDRIVLMNNGRIEQVAAPETLYRRPETEFAAEFLGESNFLPGVAAGDGGDPAIHLSSGETVAPPEGSPLSVGEAVKIMVRPEKLSLLFGEQDAAAGLNRASGTVVERIFLGGVTRHLVELADGTVVRSVTSGETRHGALAPGDAVVVAWRPDDAIVFRTENAR